jgi:hypothetical protein
MYFNYYSRLLAIPIYNHFPSNFGEEVRKDDQKLIKNKYINIHFSFFFSLQKSFKQGFLYKRQIFPKVYLYQK